MTHHLARSEPRGQQEPGGHPMGMDSALPRVNLGRSPPSNARPELVGEKPQQPQAGEGHVPLGRIVHLLTKSCSPTPFFSS